jgi:hypothetical protein
MKKIKISFTKTIDANFSNDIEKYLWETSYFEYKMQIQNIEGHKEFDLFSELVKNNAKVNNISFLVSHTIGGYIQHLHNIMPHIKNNMQVECIPFVNYNFKIVESSLKDIKKHKIEIEFYSDWIEWVETIGNHLLLKIDGGNNSHLVQIQPMMHITIQD